MSPHLIICHLYCTNRPRCPLQLQPAAEVAHIQLQPAAEVARCSYSLLLWWQVGGRLRVTRRACRHPEPRKRTAHPGRPGKAAGRWRAAQIEPRLPFPLPITPFCLPAPAPHAPVSHFFPLIASHLLWLGSHFFQPVVIGSCSATRLGIPAEGLNPPHPSYARSPTVHLLTPLSASESVPRPPSSMPHPAPQLEPDIMGPSAQKTG